jgi:hypothetical protein
MSRLKIADINGEDSVQLQDLIGSEAKTIRGGTTAVSTVPDALESLEQASQQAIEDIVALNPNSSTYTQQFTQMQRMMTLT